MTNVYLTYVTELSKLNESYVTPAIMPNFKVFNALAWGLIEEYYEYFDSGTNVENRTKEAGDVLAYITLLLLTLNCVNDVAELLDLVDQSAFNFEVCLLSYCSNLKRINREGESFNWTVALALFDFVLADIKTYGVDFKTVAETNLDKLYDRYRRDVMFSGSGDSR